MDEIDTLIAFKYGPRQPTMSWARLLPDEVWLATSHTIDTNTNTQWTRYHGHRYTVDLYMRIQPETTSAHLYMHLKQYHERLPALD